MWVWVAVCLRGRGIWRPEVNFKSCFPRSHSPCVLRQVLSLGLGAHSLGQAAWLVNPSDLPAHASSELGLQGDAITYDFSQQCRSEVKTSRFHGGNFTNRDRPSAQGKWLNQLCLTGEQKSEMYIRKTKFWRQNKNTFKIIHKKDPFELKASIGFSTKAQPQQTFPESLTCIHQVPTGFASLQHTALRPLIPVSASSALSLQSLCSHTSLPTQVLWKPACQLSVNEMCVGPVSNTSTLPGWPIACSSLVVDGRLPMKSRAVAKAKGRQITPLLLLFLQVKLQWPPPTTF